MSQQPLYGQEIPTQYDPNNTNVHYVSPQQWSSMPCEKTEYSSNWDNPQSFEAQNFAEHSHPKKTDKYFDLPFMIVFWINFVATIALMAYFVYVGRDYIKTVVEEGVEHQEKIDWQFLFKVLGIAFAISLIFNILHFCYAFFIPKVYMHIGIFIALVFIIVFSVIPMILSRIWYFIIFAVLALLVAICMYCIKRKYIKFSAAVFKYVVKNILNNPGIIGFTFLFMIFNSIVSVAFAFLIFMVNECDWSPWIYLYVVFSYLWTSITFMYVAYMTGSGVAASCYFLTNTEYFPQHPTLDSFKRAATTSFGSAAKAGLILAIVRFLRMLAHSLRSSDNGIVACIGCILECILRCIESIVSFINKYALIYCATFGVPYKEGCRRWLELSSTRFVDTIMSGCVIEDSLAFNCFVFLIVCGVAGWYAAVWLLGEARGAPVYCCVLGIVFCFTVFTVFEQPLMTMADTTLVCYAEHPENLHTSAYELSEQINEMYGEATRKD